MIRALQSALPSIIFSQTRETPHEVKASSSPKGVSSLQQAARETLHKSVDELAISEESQKLLAELIETLATSSVLELLAKAHRLIDAGETLRKEVHPYRFFLEILKNPQSKEHFSKMYEEKDHFFSGRSQIWNDFCRGSGDTFELYKGQIDQYTLSFSHSVNLDPIEVQLHIMHGNWHELLTLFATRASS